MLRLLKRLLGMHVHDWEPWSVSKGAKIRPTLYGMPIEPAYNSLIQIRKCKTCGEEELRELHI